LLGKNYDSKLTQAWKSFGGLEGKSLPFSAVNVGLTQRYSPEAAKLAMSIMHTGSASAVADVLDEGEFKMGVAQGIASLHPLPGFVGACKQTPPPPHQLFLIRL
jgi:hypothetical protein